MLRSILSALPLLIFLLANPSTRAQCTPVWLPEPGSLPSELGVNDGGVIKATALHPSGDVFVGGRFSVAGGIPANNIARYNPTTRAWTALGAGVGGVAPTVHAIVVIPGGDIIVGGSFFSAGGITAYNLARYSPPTNTWSLVGGSSGASSTVHALSFSSNFGGILIVGGEFSSVFNVLGPMPGTAGVAMYYTASNYWSSIGGGLGSVSPFVRVGAVAQMANDDVVVYDERPWPTGMSEPFRRYRWSTNTWDTSFLSYAPTTVSPDGHLIILPSGNLVMAAPGLPTGGDFAVFSPSQNSFSPLGIGLTGTATSLALTDSGDILATGVFEHPSRTWTFNVARYHPATFAWTPVDSQGNGIFNVNIPNAAVQLPSGDVIVAGPSLMVLDSVNFQGGLARYITASQRWEAAFGTQSPPNAIVTLPGGDVIVGGLFTNAGGVPVNNIARYNPVTGQWSPLGAGTNGVVNALAVLPNGNVLVGGSFTTAGGLAIFRLAQYNPATDAWSSAGGVGGGTNIAVYAILALPNGDAIVGGHFTSPGRRIARYNAATNTTSFIGHVGPSGPNSQTGAHTVYSLALHPSGDIYIGGYFPDLTTQIGNFARYSPATNTTTVLTISAGPGVISALAASPDGNIIFGFSNGAGMARYNPAASTLVQVSGSPDGAVRALSTMDSGRILVGGEFSHVGTSGTPSESLAVFDPMTNLWPPVPGALYGYNEYNSYVSALATLPGGELYAAGSFWWPTGSVLPGEIFRYNNIAHFGCPPVVGCDSIDFNNDTSLFDPQDIDAFLSVYSEGPCIPETATCNDIDFNNDGSLFDPCDIDSFLLQFSEGPCTPCGD